MAYRAEIEIGVRGVRELEQLRAEINKSATAAESLNNVVSARGSLVQNIQNYANNLNRITSTLQLVTAGTAAETKAIQEQATALIRLNSIKERQSNLLQNEVKTQLELARVQKLTAAGIFETTRFKQPIGPQVSPLQGQSSLVGERIARTIAQRKDEKALQEALLKLEQRTSIELNRQLETRGQINAALAKEVNFIRQGIKPGTQYAQPIGPQAPGVGTGLQGRLGGAVSSALIGGGFPLLFGQGTTAAAGGAVGGLAGGILGGGFGFALSIIGTAIGDAIDKSEKFNQALAALNLEVSNTGSTSKITAEDVKVLAKNLGIAEEEAIKVYSAFTGFNNANITKSLAAVFGTDAATFQSLAAVKDKADLAKVILSNYEKISIQTASQLINQLKIKDAASVEIAFQKALLDYKIRQTEEGLKQVQIQDRILAGLATAGSFLGGGNQVFSPEIFGKERVAEFRKQQKNQPDILKDTLKALQLLRSATGAADALKPDTKGANAAKKAAEEAAKEAERVKEVVRERSASAQYIQIQSNLQDKIAAAEKARDPILAARLQGEQKILDIQYDYAKQLANEKNAVAQEAITFEGLTKIIATQRDTEREINKLYAERQQKVTDTVNSLQLELDLKRATTEEERNQIQLRYDMARLREQGYSDTQIAQIEALRKQITAPETAGQTINKRIGALKDELTKLTSVGQMAITIADGIGNAFGQAFQGLISGSMSAQEALASFFKSVGDMFISMATEIIAKQMTMIILQTILKALGAIGGSSGGFGAGGNAFNTAGTVSAGTGGIPSLAPSFAYLPTKPFAAGGIVDSPMLFKFADGGTTRTGLMGEAGPEAVMPLRRDGSGRLGVSASGLRDAMAGGSSGGGGTVLNMSFETTSIGGVEYVSRDQLEAAMAQTRRDATRDGAKRGMTMTIDRLQQSPQIRSRVGLR